MANTLQIGSSDSMLVLGSLLFGPTGKAPLPSGTLTDTMVAANAAIALTKTIHQLQQRYEQKVSAGAVVVETGSGLHIARNGGTLAANALQASIVGTIATGADRTVSVDLQKSTAGGAFATVLNAPLVFNNVSTLRAVTAAVVSSQTYLAGDVFQVVVTVAGAAGNQAIGLLVNVSFQEVGA